MIVQTRTLKQEMYIQSRRTRTKLSGECLSVCCPLDGSGVERWAIGCRKQRALQTMNSFHSGVESLAVLSNAIHILKRGENTRTGST